MVYLIHFAEKFKGVQHYLGFSKDKNFEKRIEHHKKNNGACLMKAVNLAGIAWEVVRKWPKMDGNFERKLKNQKNHALLCPICKQMKEQQRRERKINKTKL